MRLSEVIENTGLTQFEKIKFSLARALVRRMRICVMDEIDVGRSSEEISELKEIVSEMREWSRKKMTMILISNDTDLLSGCDRILVLKDK